MTTECSIGSCTRPATEIVAGFRYCHKHADKKRLGILSTLSSLTTQDILNELKGRAGVEYIDASVGYHVESWGEQGQSLVSDDKAIILVVGKQK